MVWKLNISATDVKNYVIEGGNLALQAGTGFLGGHAINYINQWLHPGKIIIGKPPIPVINPMHAGICSLTFAVTDLIAKKVFEKYLGEEFTNKPICEVIRMAGTISLSALATSACLGISFSLAATAIVTSIVASAVLLGLIVLYNALVYPEPLEDDDEGQPYPPVGFTTIPETT